MHWYRTNACAVCARDCLRMCVCRGAYICYACIMPLLHIRTPTPQALFTFVHACHMYVSVCVCVCLCVCLCLTRRMDGHAAPAAAFAAVFLSFEVRRNFCTIGSCVSRRPWLAGWLAGGRAGPGRRASKAGKTFGLSVCLCVPTRPGNKRTARENARLEVNDPGGFYDPGTATLNCYAVYIHPHYVYTYNLQQRDR